MECRLMFIGLMFEGMFGSQHRTVNFELQTGKVLRIYGKTIFFREGIGLLKMIF